MIYLLFISISAFAQSIYSPETLPPVPHLTSQELFRLHSQRPQQSQPNPQLKREASTVGRNLQTNFEAIKTHLKPPGRCDTESAAQHVEALRMSGKFNACQDFVANCASAHQGAYLYAASCAADTNQFVKAAQLFEKGMQASKTSYFNMLVYQYASFAKFGIYPDKTIQIIERNPEWKDKSRIVDATLELAAFGKTSKATLLEIDGFLNSQISSSNNITRSQFLNVKLATLMKQYKYTDAKNFLVQNSAQMFQPQNSWAFAYLAFYSQSSTTFAAAREIYNPLLPYLHADSYLPMEQNTYNYSQLYQNVCRDNLLQNSDFTNFTNIRNQWKAGQLSNSQTISHLEQLNQSKPNRADLLTTLAGFYRLEGQVVQAKNLYWKAHQSCPYYNRAHWGLRLLSRKSMYEAYPEFQQIERKVVESSPESIWPPQPAQYFLNWNQFNFKVHQHIIYGAHIWLPHIPYLINNGMDTYLKLDFELLSESPNLSHIRDQRIGGSNYPNDNRLWDDVRGLGGSTVVADVWETYYTAHGDYNLLGHEMAHQFQRAAEDTASSHFIVDCIVDLYREAKQKNNFPDVYSSQNKEEHFAQGVTYYLVPKDSPPRFGLNQSWVEINNPRQFRFVQTIDDGDLRKISCL